MAMEIKINREIREYKENMFFGLSLRQLVFSVLACGVAVGIYFGLRNVLGTETLCRHGLCKIPRHDGGEICDRMGTLGISNSQAADLQAKEFIR